MKKKPSQLLAATTEEGTRLALDENLAAAEIANWKAAEAVVIEYEEAKGWCAEKVSNCGYDIKSVKDGAERHIEVKSKYGIGKKFGWTELSENETRQFWSDPNYWVYLVEGNCYDPAAIINIIELDWAELRQRAIRKEVVRFQRLGSLKRQPFKRKA